VRSLLHTYRSRFPDFEGLDLGLQSLRYLTMGTGCRDLMYQQQTKPQERRRQSEQIKALEEAVALMEVDMTDRARLQTLHTLLVPLVMSKSSFRVGVYAGEPPFPFAIEPVRMVKIKNFLVAELADLRKKVE
jgi:hypothetical protein